MFFFLFIDYRVTHFELPKPKEWPYPDINNLNKARSSYLRGQGQATLGLCRLDLATHGQGWLGRYS